MCFKIVLLLFSEEDKEEDEPQNQSIKDNKLIPENGIVVEDSGKQADDRTPENGDEQVVERTPEDGEVIGDGSLTEDDGKPRLKEVKENDDLQRAIENSLKEHVSVWQNVFRELECALESQ